MILTIFLFFLLVAFSCPIGFSMAIASLWYVVSHPQIPLMIIPERLSASLDSFPLLAVGFFILAARVMNSTGITERLFGFCLAVIGHIRGGLAYVNILASVIFAGMSGSSSADAAGLGAVEIKAMVEDDYDPAYASAVTAASATIGPIIPPSIIMIIYGVMVEESVGRLFAGGLIPGLMMAGAMMGIIYFQARSNRITFRKRTTQPLAAVLKSMRRALLPLLSPVIILGGILSGVVTPTEAGVVAVLYSLLLGFFYRELNFKKFIALLEEGALATGAIMIILSAATMFSWVVTVEKLAANLFAFLNTLAASKWLVILIINVILLFLGCFIEAFAIFVISTPILFPLIKNLGIDPVHFGVFLIVNLQIGTITPPLGLSLYIVQDISKASFKDVCKAMTPFILALMVILAVIVYLPDTVMFLPRLIFGG